MRNSLKYSVILARVSLLVSFVSLGISGALLHFAVEAIDQEPVPELQRLPIPSPIASEVTPLIELLAECKQKSYAFCVKEYTDIEEQTECFLIANEMCLGVGQEKGKTLEIPSGTVKS